MLYEIKTEKRRLRCSVLRVQEWRICPCNDDPDSEPGWYDVLVIDSAGCEERGLNA